MVYGGTGTMQLVLRNNKLLRQERISYKEVVERYSKSETIELEYNETSPVQLQKIRDRLINERKERNRKIYLTFGLMFSIFASLMLYIITT